METVLIADDEENIREGIKLIIDWKELGFEIIGDASNGEEALDAIMKWNPTLVVMDMQMPKLHGIEVIKQARRQGFEGYFIILSGYSDFGYAKEAIMNRVTNYITKPVDEDELLATVDKIKNDIEAHKKEGGRLGKIRKKARDVVIRELLQGVYQDEDPADGVRQDGIRKLSAEQREDLESMGLMAPAYQVIIHETYHSNENHPCYELPRLLETFLDPRSFDRAYLEGNTCIVLKGRAAISSFQRFIEHYEKNPIEAQSPLDLIFIAVGRAVEDPMLLSVSYQDARYLAGRRFFCEKGQHLMQSQAGSAGRQEEGSGQTECDLKGCAGKLMAGVANGSHRQVQELVDELTQRLILSGRERSDVCLMMTDLVLQLKDLVHKQYPTLADLFDTHARIIEHIEGSFYLYEITEYLMQLLTGIMNKLHENAGTDHIIEYVMEYTDRNYAHPLTLEEIAAVYGYNSGYLGRLFTRVMGSSYSYYLNECRIRKAQELLNDGKTKVYEVAELVGYKDVDYFGRKFRKHTGMTPAEFRAQARKGRDARDVTCSTVGPTSEQGA